MTFRFGFVLAWRSLSASGVPAAAQAQDQTQAPPEEHDGPASRCRVEVQFRRELGHVRVRQFPVSGSEGRRRDKPNRPVARGRDQAEPVGQPQTGAPRAEIYGKVSAVGERTYGAAPTLLGGDASSFQVEDLSLGWRSGTRWGAARTSLDFTVGRTTFNLGHGLLLWDGAAEGGSRGGYWTNARKAFQFAAIGRFHSGSHKAETVRISTRTSSRKTTRGPGYGW